MNVAMYLRKSRADIEAEARGEGETLSKHKKALLKIAREQNLNIIKIYEEIVSGESIIHRPEMVKLLQDVEAGMYDAVLCMDLDRLGRGNKIDQGMIEETFKKSKTNIITSRKTYNLEDEWDEEYMEFETFMARRELKMINRRMQRGRIASVEAGNYIGTYAPYGYVIKELPDGRTLEPDPDKAQVVKLIFQWYTHDIPEKRMGSGLIANELNKLGYQTATGKKWANWAVLSVLKNAVYAGRIQWKKKEEKKSAEPDKIMDVRTRPKEEWIDVEGKHEPLISMETFQKAQDILGDRYHVPYQIVNGVRNPLAGVVKCGFCGGAMVYRPYTNQKPHLKCYNQPRCRCKATNFELVEQKLLDGLREWLQAYKANWEDYTSPSSTNIDSKMIEIKKAAIKNLEKELIELEKQKHNLHDLLERGIYNEQIFLERSEHLMNKTNEITNAIEETKVDILLEEKRQKAQHDVIPRVERVLDLYRKTNDPAKKNSLLKSVLEKAVYKKEKHQYRENFTLILYPILPQDSNDF